MSILTSKESYAIGDKEVEVFKSIFFESLPENQKGMMAEAWELAAKKGNRIAISTSAYAPEVNLINKPVIASCVQSFLVNSVSREEFKGLAKKYSV
jgi:hypothetical protein